MPRRSPDTGTKTSGGPDTLKLLFHRPRSHHESLLTITKRETSPDGQEQKIEYLENFLRPLEKQDPETLDEMFAKAQECIADHKEIAEKLKRRTRRKAQ